MLILFLYFSLKNSPKIQNQKLTKDISIGTIRNCHREHVHTISKDSDKNCRRIRPLCETSNILSLLLKNSKTNLIIKRPRA